MDDDEAAPTDAAPSPRPTLTSRLLAPRPRRQPVADAEQSTKVLDRIERRWGFAAVALLLGASLSLIPHLQHDTIVKSAVQKVHGKWPVHSGCTALQKTCSLSTIYHPSDFWPFFIAAGVLSLVLLAAVLRSARTLAIFTVFFGGLAVGTFSILATIGAFGWGTWLLARSWRFTRTGAKDAKTARQASMERVAERREQRRAAKGAPAAATATATSAAAARRVEKSKRYTPAKSRTRRR